MMEQMLDKALKGRGQVDFTGGGRGETSGQADTNKGTPGEPGMEGPREWRVGQQADQGAQWSVGSGAVGRRARAQGARDKGRGLGRNQARSGGGAGPRNGRRGRAPWRE